MGLLRRKNPAEKKLKELTGGFLISDYFIEILNNVGLDSSDGYDIQRQLKADIKRGDVKEDGVETRLNFLIEKRIKEKKASSDFKQEDSLNEVSSNDNVKELKFLLNQEHNLIKCPNCDKKILKRDKFCYSCGFELSKENGIDFNAESISETDFGVGSSIGYAPEVKVENTFYPSMEYELDAKVEDTISPMSDSSAEVLEPKDVSDELSELEKLYNKKVSTKYSPKFKFAYVLYLDEINKNPNKSIKNDYYKSNYDTSLTKIKKQAKEDEFIGEGSPLIAAKSATVKDLKKLLKDHDLMVSGTKDELIERLGENLTEEELKEVFPKKVFSVSEKGREFIEENKYVFYYDKTTPIRSYVEVEEYDSIFDDVNDLSDENIHKLLIDFLEKREDELVSKKNWGGYRYNFMALARVYKDSGNEFKVLDNDFKLFIAGINNFNDYTNHSEPAYGYIGKTYSKELVELLHSLSLSIDDLKAKFNAAYDDLKYPELKISQDESLVYLLKLFSGEDIQDLTEEIRSKYPDPNLNYSF